jgi:hypothetical protein
MDLCDQSETGDHHGPRRHPGEAPDGADAGGPLSAAIRPSDRSGRSGVGCDAWLDDDGAVLDRSIGPAPGSIECQIPGPFGQRRTGSRGSDRVDERQLRAEHLSKAVTGRTAIYDPANPRRLVVGSRHLLIDGPTLLSSSITQNIRAGGAGSSRRVVLRPRTEVLGRAATVL